MRSNEKLRRAWERKNDEFYTQLADIEKELVYYSDQFKDKVVYCNCDNPHTSMFFRYFVDNFNKLGLKKLMATYWDGYESQGEYVPAKLAIVNSVDEERLRGGIAELLLAPENVLYRLKGDGDFRSEECLKLLDDADIVVTNPPFSLFREYFQTLTDHGKKFLIIGHMNAVSYKNVFPLIRDGKVWLGVSIHSGGRAFYVPDGYTLDATKCGVEESTGRRFIHVTGVRWFTNLPHTQTQSEIPLVQSYTPDKYPKYDDYDAIEVSRTALIPSDYFGKMGVPITFLDRYNPNQFEILGLDGSGSKWRGKGLRLNGKFTYRRIIIQRKKTC